MIAHSKGSCTPSSTNNCHRLLDKLVGTRRIGVNRWVTKCPAHEDRSPSLSVKELNDGRILLHCFAGCDIHSIVSSIGFELSDLYPDSHKIGHVNPQEPTLVPLHKIINVLSAKLTVILCAAQTLTLGNPLSNEDGQTLAKAVEHFDIAARYIEEHYHGQGQL